MDKATPTPASVDSVMALKKLLSDIAAMLGPTADSYASDDPSGAIEAAYSVAVEAIDICAEVERLAAQPSQAPVVQAGEYPPLPQGKAVIRCVADTDEGGWVVDFDCEGPLSHEPQEGDELFTADQMHAYLDADRASSGATTAQAVRMLTPEEPEKCYSLDEETFYDLGDLIDMLDEEQAKPGILVYEGESVRHKASHYARGAVANLFERMGEQAFDDAGEHIGDWPDHAVKDDNLAEFEKLIYDWLDANVKVHFYTVKNVRQIALTADMLGDDNAGRAIPADGKIGGV